MTAIAAKKAIEKLPSTMIKTCQTTMRKQKIGMKMVFAINLQKEVTYTVICLNFTIVRFFDLVLNSG